jgi:hypothetical protein
VVSKVSRDDPECEGNATRLPAKARNVATNGHFVVAEQGDQPVELSL